MRLRKKLTSFWGRKTTGRKGKPDRRVPPPSSPLDFSPDQPQSQPQSQSQSQPQSQSITREEERHNIEHRDILRFESFIQRELDAAGAASKPFRAIRLTHLLLPNSKERYNNIEGAKKVAQLAIRAGVTKILTVTRTKQQADAAAAAEEAKRATVTPKEKRKKIDFPPPPPRPTTKRGACGPAPTAHHNRRASEHQSTGSRQPDPHEHIHNNNRQCRAANARIIELAGERKRLVDAAREKDRKKAKMASAITRDSDSGSDLEENRNSVEECNLDLPPNTSQAKVAHAFQAITKLRDWTKEKLQQEARERKAADAREARIRSKEIQEVRDKHDELARKFFEPYLEIKGRDMQKYAPKNKRDRGTEPAKFCELVEIKYGITIDQDEIVESFYQGEVLVAKFSNQKEGSAYQRVNFRGKGAWEGKKEVKLSVDRKKSVNEREALSCLSWIRRRDKDAANPRVFWCRMIPRGVAYKSTDKGEVHFVRNAEEAKKIIGNPEEVKEFEEYTRKLRSGPEKQD